MTIQHTLTTLESSALDTVTGGATNLQTVTNAVKGFGGGLACLAKFTVDGTPGTNTYDTYLACQRKVHQF
jgi:hypothetical protein